MGGSVDVVLGKVAEDRKQFDRAEPMYRKAIELNPNYATAHHWFSGLLADRDRMDEGLGYAEKAAALDPLSAIINSNLATNACGVRSFYRGGHSLPQGHFD